MKTPANIQFTRFSAIFGPLIGTAGALERGQTPPPSH